VPYKSDKQRRYLHSQKPEIASKWDAEMKKRKPISKGRMTDEQLSRAQDRQADFSLAGSGLGLTGLGLLGASVATKKKPPTAIKLRHWGTNSSITAGGVGALSGINFARIQREESQRNREIKKANTGIGFAKYEREYSPKKVPFTVSRKAADPERSRERRARAYPVLMGVGAGGTGFATYLAAKSPKKAQAAKIDARILQSKTLRVGAGAAGTALLLGGAAYNSRSKNRNSYEGQWYPQRERGKPNI
jgi:hypothetical protein